MSKENAGKGGRACLNPATHLSAGRSPKGLEEKLVMLSRNLKHGIAI